MSRSVAVPSAAEHIPVLEREVCDLLCPKEGETVLDATLGLGGHSQVFLTMIGQEGRLIGLDCDGENLALARERLRSSALQCDFRHANFRSIAELGLPTLDAIFADLGLSSPHIDDPSRGFTFRTEAELDLRFDRSQGEKASEVIAALPEAVLARTFSSFGELPGALRLAHAVKTDRPLTTTALAECVRRVFGYRAPTLLPRVFQALRMQVNDEMGSLRDFLSAAPALLAPGGRLAVISYHSLEDRMTKNTFRALTEEAKDDRTGASIGMAPFTLLTRKPIRPSEAEVSGNPRSRSAHLRAILKRPV
ncbi:MAG: 16S rRNA (cytosine(1402)-N(4))-methyltransferase RsmH [Candidatus Peregrinibacteria bacterium]